MNLPTNEHPALLLLGDSETRLRELPDNCVHCFITSPPYWGLRDYGTGEWIGGDPECEHKTSPTMRKGRKEDRPMLAGSTSSNQYQLLLAHNAACKCGAVKQDFQIGLEPTLQEFITKLVDLFREVRRLLHPSGTLFVNMGDSYNAAGREGHGTRIGAKQGTNRASANGSDSNRPTASNLKPKDLCGVPWRLAFALQDDGWYLRSDIPWVKRSPMPESTTDRPGKALEYIFMLSKEPHYYFDMEAVRKCYADDRNGQPGNYQRGKVPSQPEDGEPMRTRSTSANPSSPAGRNFRNADLWFQSFESPHGLCGIGDELIGLDVTSQGYAEAHFACVDADTECLTIEGWKRYDELRPGMLAAQFDIDSERLSWGTIEHVAIYPVVDEKMVAAKSRDVEMLLTPNHRTIIKRRHPKTRGWQACTVIRADELKKQHAIPVSGEWDGEWIEPVTPEWAELIGWYIAEGCETIASWKVEIYQSRAANPAKVDRIRELLVATGAEYTEATAPRTWQGRDATMTAFQIHGFAAIRLRQLCPNKTFPVDVLSWSNRLLDSLLAGLVDGDGHRREDGRFSFIQRSKVAADTVQAIGVRVGYSTMLSIRSEETYSVYFTRKRQISFRGTGGEGARIEHRSYTGVVWCPKLPMGTWLARKNGRAFVTGNTFPMKLVEPFVLAGTSAKGVCPKCLEPWRRVVDRERVATRPGEKTKLSLDRQTGEHIPLNGKPWSSAEVGNRDPKRHVTVTQTSGWKPGCECEAGEPIPATVGDPFLGSATTLAVAIRNGRFGIGVELNPKYLELAKKRLSEPMGVGNLYGPQSIEIHEQTESSGLFE